MQDPLFSPHLRHRLENLSREYVSLFRSGIPLRIVSFDPTLDLYLFHSRNLDDWWQHTDPYTASEMPFHDSGPTITPQVPLICVPKYALALAAYRQSPLPLNGPLL